MAILFCTKLLRDFIVQSCLHVASLVIGAIVFDIPATYFGGFWPSIGVAAIVVLILDTFTSVDNPVAGR